MTASVTVRAAASTDAERLAFLAARAFTAAYEADVPHESLAQYVEYAFQPEVLAQELADPAAAFLVAESDGNEIGYAKLLEGGDSPAAGARRPIELARLYVATSWIGKGVGARLMEAALEEAARRDCDRIWLGVWQRNPRAIEFYRRWGFREVGRQPFTMGGEMHEDVLMDRSVRDPAASTMSPSQVDEGAAR